MGLDYDFHLQKHTGEGWMVPAELTNSIGRSLKFTWISGKDLRSCLFFGEKALFPMYQTFPPEVDSIGLFQRDPDVFSEWFHGWLSVEELFLDYWDETFLFISRSVEAKYAPLFGDGQQLFPKQMLLSAGLDGGEADSLENSLTWIHNNCEIIEAPLDYTQGKDRFALEGVPSHYQVRVTWKVTVSHFLGPWITQCFRSVRQYGQDEELRILCYYS